jgi:hypothetical protein
LQPIAEVEGWLKTELRNADSIAGIRRPAQPEFYKKRRALKTRLGKILYQYQKII